MVGWLIELGKLLLASKKNDNNNRKIEDIKKNASNNIIWAQSTLGKAFQYRLKAFYSKLMINSLCLESWLVDKYLPIKHNHHFNIV